VMAGWKFSHLAGEIIHFGTDGKPLQVTAGQIGQSYPDPGLYLEERFHYIPHGFGNQIHHECLKKSKLGDYLRNIKTRHGFEEKEGDK
jgi:hypothetical protein